MITTYGKKHKQNCQCCACKSVRGELFGKNNSAYIDGRTTEIYYCIDCGKRISCSSGFYGEGRCLSCSNSKKNKGRVFTEEHKKQLKYIRKGEKLSLATRKKISQAKLQLFKNKKFKNEVIKRLLNTKKNKINISEKKLQRILYNTLPKEYKFVGNGKLVLDGLCPDFINCNGQKKIIELYGDYWHNLPSYKERDKRRIKTYAKYGYKTLIIWEHELENLTKVENKLKGLI